MSINNSISESVIVDAMAQGLARRLSEQQHGTSTEPVFPGSSSKAGGGESPVEACAEQRNDIAFPPSGSKAGGGE